MSPYRPDPTVPARPASPGRTLLVAAALASTGAALMVLDLPMILRLLASALIGFALVVAEQAGIRRERLRAWSTQTPPPQPEPEHEDAIEALTSRRVSLNVSVVQGVIDALRSSATTANTADARRALTDLWRDLEIAQMIKELEIRKESR